MVAWGLEKSKFNLKQKIFQVRVLSPNSWSPPLTHIIELNFNGAFKGNAGPKTSKECSKALKKKIFSLTLGLDALTPTTLMSYKLLKWVFFL
jgi:hypothetical protein